MKSCVHSIQTQSQLGISYNTVIVCVCHAEVERAIIKTVKSSVKLARPVVQIRTVVQSPVPSVHVSQPPLLS